MTGQQGQQDLHAGTMPSVSTTSLGHNNNNYYYNANSTTNRYDDDDLEIIDSFLENVFYLIGAQQHIVPAAAA